MTAHRIGFLIWPSTKALTLALAEAFTELTRESATEKEAA